MDLPITPLSVGRGRGGGGRNIRATGPPDRLIYDRMGGRNPDVPTLVVPNRSRSSRAGSIASTAASSTAVQIQANEVDIGKRIRELEEEIEEKEESLQYMGVELEDKQDQLTQLESKDQDPQTASDIKLLEAEIRNLKLSIRRADIKLAALRKSFDKRKKIIEDDGKLQSAIIEDGNNDQNLSDEDSLPDDTPTNNTGLGAWLNTRQQRTEDKPDDVLATQDSSSSPQGPSALQSNSASSHPTVIPLLGNQQGQEPNPGQVINHSYQYHDAHPDQAYTAVLQNQGQNRQTQQQFRDNFQPQQDYANQRSTPIPDGREAVVELVTMMKDAFAAPSTSNQRYKALPNFSGSPQDWLVFKSEFQRTKSKDPGVNLSRLREHLRKDAKDAVYHLMANPGNVDRIMESLEKRFGNPEHIIFSLIENVKKVKAPDLNKPESIIDFGVAVDALVTNIISYDMREYLTNIQLLKELGDKLPPILRREWYNYLGSGMFVRPKNLQTFQSWMNREMESAYQCVKPRNASNEDEDKPRRGRESPKPRRRNPGVAAATESDSCNFCENSGHSIGKCRKFASLDLDERFAAAKERGLCYLCLEKGHRSTKCQKKSKCGVDSCTGPHHRLLHRSSSSKGDKDKPKQKEENVSQLTPEDEADSDEPSAPIYTATGGTMCLIPVQVSGPKGTETVLALLDTGSSLTMLEGDVAKKIGLEGKKKPLTFNVFGKDVRTHNDSQIVNLKMKGTQRNAVDYQIDNVRTVAALGIPACPFDITKLKEKHPYLEPVRAKNVPNMKPKMIIGYDNHRLFCPMSNVEDPEEKGPSGHHCRLGWYVSGVTGGRGCYFACPSCHNETDEVLHHAMKEFFSVEDSGIKPHITPSRSKEDKRALEILERTTRKVGDQWETALLWKDDDPVLPSSKNMAMNRLAMMEKKMDKNPEFGTLCCEKFDDYIKKGYLVPADTVKEKVKPSKRKWYLPWFFAYHATKKPRLVFDGAAKAGGKSLNDFLLKGPDMLNSLPDVLMRFRSYPVAITADIREMFHQVKLTPDDWPSQTILYRGLDRDKPPQEYFMTVLFFGSASSPCSAIFTKDKNARLYEKEYPAAVNAILNNFYMDDYLGGANSVGEAIQLQKEMSWIHAQGGMELCKWNSSSPEVIAAIPEKMRAERQQMILQKGDATLEKTLGMWWNPDDDLFQFKLNLKKIPVEVRDGQRKPTKREVTSFVMALFDPLGFLAPIKVRALIIIQNVWKSGIAWDVEVTDGVLDQWNSWLVELEEVRSVEIKRKYLSQADTEKLDDVDIHVFVDASEEAYSCALYFLFESNGKKEMSFVAGKARVAPLKGLTIPRMELQAALLGSRLSATVYSCMKDIYNFRSTTLWGDSKTVLCWLRSETGRYKTFVQTRVGEILEITNSAQWKWIPTKLNVADDATRFRSLERFSSSSRWLTGVPFLLEEKRNWPIEKTNVRTEVIEEELELRPALFVAHQDMRPIPLPDITHFSSWFRLIRATALMFTYLRYLKKTQPYHITIDDQRKAEAVWTRKSQQESFSAELKLLAEDKELPKTSRLAFLSPRLKNGIIILGGRINAAPGVSETVKNPPILDPANPYTKLLLEWHHRIGRHQGQERVIAEVRKRAWVIDCRRAVRSCWANCQLCKLRKLQPATPEMGQLPSCRLGEKKIPFAHTGVDYFGPFKVKVNCSTVKRWGVIFTCMSSRGVHLELADSLEAGEFINVLTRFACTRGTPSDLWCDNGSNFVGAKREMRKALKAWDEDEVRRTLAVKGIEFHFQPPASPHMGGSFERLIGIAKRILSNMLKSQAPRESILRTVLCEAMDIMNSRPTTYASTDPNDANCLTPNHLLRQSCMETAPIPGLFEEQNRYRSAWKYCQYLGDEFWRRWTDECLPLMAKRTAWREKAEPLKRGDVVILRDDLLKRSSWKKGIIVKTFPGKDGQVRVVDVRVAIAKPGQKAVRIKIYRRPAVKIIPLGESIVLDQHWEEECSRVDEN